MVSLVPICGCRSRWRNSFCPARCQRAERSQQGDVPWRGAIKAGRYHDRGASQHDDPGISLAREYPEANERQTATVRPIRDVMFGGGSTTVVFASAVLLIVVGIVLLIACSNVANLLLARSAVAAAGDGGPPGDGSQPPKACASTSDREHVPRTSQRCIGTFRRLCRDATPRRNTADVWHVRRAEIRCGSASLCARHLSGNGLPFRHHPGVPGLTSECRGNPEGGGPHGGQESEEDHAGKHPARRPGRIFVSSSGDGSVVPSKHPASVRHRSGLPDRTSRGLRPESRAGRVRRVADQSVLQGRARACGERSRGRSPYRGLRTCRSGRAP